MLRTLQALNLASVGVAWLSKRELTLCNSSLAQEEFIGVYNSPEDSPEKHKNDTFVAGGFENDPESTDVLVNEAKIDIAKIIDLGVDFDKMANRIITELLRADMECINFFHHKDATG